MLRVDIAGAWDVREFGHLLTSIDQGYNIVHQLQLLRDMSRAERADEAAWFEDQQSRERPQPFFAELVTGRYELSRHERETWIPPVTEQILSVVDVYITHLRLKSVSYSSPGWVEVIGAWNPVKVIADMVIRWRQQRLDLEMARLQAETERMRMKNELMIDMVELLRDIAGGGRGNAAERVSIWTREVLPQLEKAVLAIASDPRVSNVQAVVR